MNESLTGEQKSDEDVYVYWKKDDKLAMKYFRLRASVDAAFSLGELYLSFEMYNRESAIEYLKKAADKGHLKAIEMLATLFSQAEPASALGDVMKQGESTQILFAPPRSLRSDITLSSVPQIPVTVEQPVEGKRPGSSS